MFAFFAVNCSCWSPYLWIWTCSV